MQYRWCCLFNSLLVKDCQYPRDPMQPASKKKRRKSRMSLRTAICNLLPHAVACCDKANKVRVIRKRVQFNQSAKKVVTNDSIGTFSPGLYILYFLKLPAPPRADLCYEKFPQVLVFSEHLASRFLLITSLWVPVSKVAGTHTLHLIC